MIHAVVFDFDGTLVDTNAVKHEAYGHVFASLTKLIGPKANAIISSALAKHVNDDRWGVIEGVLDAAEASGYCPSQFGQTRHEQVKALAQAYNSICEHAAIAAPEMPGARALLARLCSRLTLHINTATPETSIRAILVRRGLLQYFASVHGAESGKAEALRSIITLEGLVPKEVLMVGDSEADLEAARAVGVASVGYQHASSRLISAPNYQITALEQMEVIIERHDERELIHGR